MGLNNVDESTLTVAGTSVDLESASPTLTAALALGARQAAIIVQTAPVHCREDGDDATTADMILYPGDILQVSGGDEALQILRNLRFIRSASGVSSTLVIKWYNRETMALSKVIRAKSRFDGGIGHGVETVDSAGTDQAIVTSSTPAKGVIVQAQTDNTDAIAVGATGVDATIATGNGIILYAGDSVYIPCDNLDAIYIDAIVTGEGVRFTYFT